MVYTVTFNPAVDYVMHMGPLVAGETNRSTSEEIYWGGKGLNVSVVLNELGIASRALGFVAGFTGMALEAGMAELGVECDFVHLKKGFSRINVKLKADEETEINGQGPSIDEDEIAQLFDKLNSLTDGDVLILAGSIPSTLPSDMYEKILAMLSDRKIKFVVDATRDLLLKVLPYKPFLIKPNKFELGEMFGVNIVTEEDTIKYATKLQQMGAVNVLISMAGDGALLLDENGQIHSCGVCKGKVKNSVGAGDSMVAGFVAGSIDGDYEYALKLGTASGGATAFSDGLAKRELIDELLAQL